MIAPPRLPALLLRILLRNPELSEAILGDLEEELAGLLASGSFRSHPRLWYWKAILGLSARFALSSFPGVVRKGEDSSPLDGEGRRRTTLESMVQDFGYALRGLRKSPGFTIASILTLTVGIGANVALFSVIETVLLRPLPFPEPERLVLGLGTVEGEPYTQTVSAHDYADLEARSDAFESLGAQTAWPWMSSVTGGPEPLRLPTGWVSVNFFRTLGIRPVLGRDFTPREGAAGAPNVALISQSFWQQGFGGDPEIVGQAVSVDGTPVTIVGVIPAGARIRVDADLWLPMRLGEAFAGGRRYQNFVMVGRLRPALPLEQAQSQADVVAAELAAAYPATNRGEGFRITPLREALTQGYRRNLLLMVTGVALLLLIACGNLAALFLARGLRRQTEFSVRVALGASRRRILRQLLVETLAISLFGGFLGGLAAWAAHGVILAHLPFQVPFHVSAAGMSSRILAFVLLVSLGTGLLIGLIPGLRAAGRDAAQGLKASPRFSAGGGGRIRGGLVVAQVALSMVLLMASGLLIRTLLNLQTVDLGFDPEGLLAVDLELPASRYPDAESRRIFFSRLDEGIRAVPGVLAVGMIDRLPVRTTGGNTYVYPVGERPATDEQARTANERWVMPGYFGTMGIPILRGRGIQASDGPAAPGVLVVNEAMARAFFPGQDPLGRRLFIDFDERAPLEVVGVAGDVLFDGPAHETFPAMYHSYFQEPVTRMEIAVRTAGGVAAPVSSLREAIRSLDPNLPVSDVERMEAVIAGTVGDRKVLGLLITLFAGAAGFLTALGLYGVLAYHVGQRIPELGLRMALGADPRSLVGHVAQRGLGLLSLGMVLGVSTSLGATRFLEALLFGVEPTDFATFLLASLAFFSVGILASLLPARRAFRVDPVKALHAE